MDSFLAPKQEEKFIEYFARMVAMIFRENPDMIRFIADTAKKGS